MADRLEQIDQAAVASLRSMALQGRSPSEMVCDLKKRLGAGLHIATLLDYFRQAFCLTVAEVKPIAALSRNEQREIEDEHLLNELLTPAIQQHRTDWAKR